MILFMFAGSTHGGAPGSHPGTSPYAGRGLLDRVDRRQDLVRLDLLGERLFHWRCQLQEFGAVGEDVDADLSFGLQLFQDLVVLPALPLPPPGGAIQPGLEDGVR
jgi:hypothetical protein